MHIKVLITNLRYLFVYLRLLDNKTNFTNDGERNKRGRGGN